MKINPSAIFIAAVLSSTIAHAVDFEASVGMSKFNSAMPGLWYTPGFENNLGKMESKGGEFAIVKNIWGSASGQYGLNLRGSYVYLGSIHTSAQSPNRNTRTVQGRWVGEDFIDARPGNPCDGTCNNLAEFNGSGHDMGLTLQLEPYVRYKGYKLGVNAGLYEHRTTWAVDVNNLWDGLENHDVTVESEAKWTAGKVIGVSVEKNNFIVRLQYFMTPLVGGKYPQPYDRVYMLSVGYKF